MDEQIKQILDQLTKQAELEKLHKVKVRQGDHMLAITEDTGMFFNIFLKAIKARNVLEIGTSTGYSTIWFADAIKESGGGKITTIEYNPKKIARAQANFEQAQVSKFIEIKQGKVIEILQELHGTITSNSEQKFDFVFIDADKENTIQYFDLILDMTKKGGIIATDNILYPEKFRAEMKRFSEHVKSKQNTQTIIVPIGNGEEITIKTSD